MTDSVTTSSAAARVDAIVGRYRDDVVGEMRSALDLPGVAYTDLVRYHLGWQDEHGGPAEGRAGKMLRPALCLLCVEAAGGDARRALPAAGAIELLHNFTLIHDDIEDRSATRHGRPTLWTLHGVAQAINAGDGLFAIAHRALLRLADAGASPDVVVDAARRLDDASIALCQGQMADLSFEARETVSMAEYESMVAGKSAALIDASAAIGALVGGAPADIIDAFSRYGLALGLGFQIQDDVLGIWGSPDHTGKPAGDDIRARKKSHPIVYAMEQLNEDGRAELARMFGGEEVSDASVARVRALLENCGARDAATAAARRHVDDAVAALRGVEMDAARRVDLEAIARFAVDRQV